MNQLLLPIALAVVLLHGTVPARAGTVAAVPAGPAAPAKARGAPDGRIEFDDVPDAGDRIAGPAGPAAAAVSSAPVPGIARAAAPGPAQPDTGALLLAAVGFVGTVAVRRSQRHATT